VRIIFKTTGISSCLHVRLFSVFNFQNIVHNAWWCPLAKARYQTCIDHTIVFPHDRNSANFENHACGAIINYSQCHRCTSRKIFGGATIFSRTSPNLPEKIFGYFLCECFLMTSVSGITSKRKKGLHLILHTLGAIFSNESTFLPVFSGNLPRFSGILRRFSQILPKIPRIFTKSKLLGVHLHLHLLHHRSVE